MKAHGFAVKLAALSGLFFAGYCLFPENSCAQACPYAWPEIGIEWRFGPDNYYTYGNLSSDYDGVIMSAGAVRFL